MSKETKLLSKRKWLNPKDHNDTGLIAYSVLTDEGDEWASVDAFLDIWDCSRKISLNFCFDNDKQAKNRAKKIDYMISALEEMKEAMAEAYDKIDFKETNYE
jgi:hypothetical protein